MIELLCDPYKYTNARTRMHAHTQAHAQVWHKTHQIPLVHFSTRSCIVGTCASTYGKRVPRPNDRPQVQLRLILLKKVFSQSAKQVASCQITTNVLLQCLTLVLWRTCSCRWDGKYGGRTINSTLCNGGRWSTPVLCQNCRTTCPAPQA